MFTISQSSSYLWPIVVELPTDGGKMVKQTFDGEFKRLPSDRLIEIQNELRSDDVMNDLALAKELLVGWKGVTSDGKEELPFSESARDGLLNIIGVPSAVVRAFFESITGAKRKN